MEQVWIRPFHKTQKRLRMQQIILNFIAIPAQDGEVIRADLAIRKVPIIAVQKEHTLDGLLDCFEAEQMRAGLTHIPTVDGVEERRGSKLGEAVVKNSSKRRENLKIRLVFNIKRIFCPVSPVRISREESRLSASRT